MHDRPSARAADQGCGREYEGAATSSARGRLGHQLDGVTRRAVDERAGGAPVARALPRLEARVAQRGQRSRRSRPRRRRRGRSAARPDRRRRAGGSGCRRAAPTTRPRRACRAARPRRSRAAPRSAARPARRRAGSRARRAGASWLPPRPAQPVDLVLLAHDDVLHQVLERLRGAPPGRSAGSPRAAPRSPRPRSRSGGRASWPGRAPTRACRPWWSGRRRAR